MTVEELGPVIGTGMCIGCGACIAADPALSLVFDETRQMWQPSGAGNSSAAAVCPAVQVDFDRLHEMVFPGQEVGDQGVVDRVLLAQSTTKERNLSASSGGMIKELLLVLLESREIDGVIALDVVEGLDYQPRVISDPSEVDSLPGSIYHHVRFDEALRLLREKEGRFALVAIPCQLEGIYNYISQCEPELLDRIHTTIGLICGWLYTHHSLRAIASYKGIPFEEVTGVSYRGGGPVGRLRLQTDHGEKAVSRRIDFGYQVAFDRSFNTTRCHVCVNHSNFLADIVVGDAWLPSTVGTRTGVSLIICRRAGIYSLIDQMVEAGRIIVADVSFAEVVESQTHRVVFGDFAYAYADYRRELGLHTPDMTGPNRRAALLVPRREVERFHQELLVKQQMQMDRRYRALWWRKLTREAGRLAARYARWFLVRILRINTLLGIRKSVSHEKVSIFR